MNDEWVLAYVPTDSTQLAESIGETLVLEGLAGCVNIIPSMKSIYVWKGKLEASQEVLLIVKTHRSRQVEVEKRILVMHSYETPCILFLPISGGNSAYLNWLAQGCRLPSDH